MSNHIFGINTLKELYSYSVKKYSDNPLFSFFDGSCPMTYKDFGQKTDMIAKLLDDKGYGKRDRIAIWSQNMPDWPVAFFSITAFDKIAVPLLPDFSPAEVENILKHSGSKALFVSKRLYANLTEESKKELSTIIITDSFEIVKDDPVRDDIDNSDIVDDLALIIYTSGTTGSSKGVMLTNRNLCATLNDAVALRPSFEWDVWLSILPLSHTLECSLSMLLPFFSGSQVKYLDKAPTPTILMKALKNIRPTTMLSVPLIIEKVYRNAVLPAFKKNKFISFIYTLTPGRIILHRVAGKKLMKKFGGRIRFFGIGGAKLDSEVERFLYEAHFPYAIGYGLTETSPLLAGAIGKTLQVGSTGPATEGVTLRIDNPDPATGEGEIVAKGDNIMPGYYKNPEATEEAFTSDGWFKTKDLGILDRSGKLFIKGRLGNMIVGASGENIYPEEIETVINSYPLVNESIVTKKDGKLTALVRLSADTIESIRIGVQDYVIDNFREIADKLINTYEERRNEYIVNYSGSQDNFKADFDKKRSELFRMYNIRRQALDRLHQWRVNIASKEIQERVDNIKTDILDYVNSRVNNFSKISRVVFMDKDFEKTATQKIKRFLYK